MSSWPVLDRAPVQLLTLPGHDDELWVALIELSELRPGEWTLVGGQMVFLHAIEHEVSPPRVSTDLDLLVNARVVTGSRQRSRLIAITRCVRSGGRSGRAVRSSDRIEQ